MGVVYHTHYLDYFEAARTEALRELGVTYKELEAGGVQMPVVDLAAQYRRPARYDDVLEITTTIREAPTTRLRLDYAVRRAGEEEVLVTGHVTLCFFDPARGRPIATPDHVADLIARHF